MRKFSKKLAFVLAAAMVFTAFAPAASAKAADDMVINKKSQILYVTDGTGINDDKNVPDAGKTVKGNVAEYDFWVKNKPTNYGKLYKFDWKSSKPTVATVDQKGLTKAVSIGTATITCTITDKATGKEVAAPTVKVEVKKNATSVKITNAPASDAVYGVGDTVDLNRTMIDNNGKKGGRGKYVTDYTKWVAVAPNGDSSLDKNIGVTIDQSNGKYTFTEAAADGKYEFYCYTYQSSKYPKATATSEKITVTFQKAKTFAVVQSTCRVVTLYFDSPVASLETADVTVNNVRNAGYPVPVKVQSAKLAEDGMSADVTFFYAVDDQVPYKFNVTGFEPTTKVLSNGKIADLKVVAVDGNGNVLDPSNELTTNSDTSLTCIFIDGEGIVVGQGTNGVTLSVTKQAANGDYLFNPGTAKLRFNKAGVTATIKASYQGWFENGKRVGQFERTFDFYAKDAAKLTIAGVADYTLNPNNNGYGWGENAVKSFEINQNPQLSIKLMMSNGVPTQNAVTITNLGTGILANGKLTFTALDPDICVVNNSGVLTGHKSGFAQFYVNVKVGNGPETPIDVITVEVKDAASLQYINNSNPSVTIGTAAGFNTAEVVISAHSQYGLYSGLALQNAQSQNNYTITCLTDGYGDKAALVNAINVALTPVYGVPNAGLKLTVNATTLRAAAATSNQVDVADNGQIFAVDFEIKYQDKATYLTVYVQEPSGNAADNQIYVEDNTNGTFYKDALRVNDGNDNDSNAEAAKDIQFKAFYVNNGVKVANFEFKEPNAATAGEFYYKVLKDGMDLNPAVASRVTNITVATKTVGATVPLSGVTPLTNNVVNGKIVNYDNLGAGYYQFLIFKRTNTVDECVYSTAVDVGLGLDGGYYEDGDQYYNHISFGNRPTGTYDATIAKEIVKCFDIKAKDNKGLFNDDGNTFRTVDAFYVEYTPVPTSGYVYVKQITFYELVEDANNAADDVYVPYVVYLDRALDMR